MDIPNSVTAIGELAFSGCYSLTSMDIPNSVTAIGELAFKSCSSLGSIRLPNTLTDIEFGVFYGCKQLESLTIPASVTSIILIKTTNYPYFQVAYSFTDCINLRTLTFEGETSDSVDFLSDGDGYNDENVDSPWLSKYVLFNNVQHLYIDRPINLGTWESDIETLEIGPNLTEFSSLLLKYQSNLKKIICNATVPPTIPTCTNKQYMDMEVIVPEESLDLYKKADTWKNFWNIVGFDTASAGNSHMTFKNPEEISRYSLDGKRVDESYKGIVVIRFSDGSTKKIMQ